MKTTFWMMIAIVWCALSALACAHEPTTRDVGIQMGPDICRYHLDESANGKHQNIEQFCSNPWMGRGMYAVPGLSDNPIVTHQQAVIAAAAKNPPSAKCQPVEVVWSDGRTTIEQECLPAEARTMQARPAR